MTLIPKIDYTSRDFVAIRDDLVKSVWYGDRLANENFLDTAISRQSVIRLLNYIGVDIKGVQAAQADVIFSIDTPLGYDLNIPAGTQIQSSTTNPTILFETDEDTVISTGQTQSGTVGVTEGETLNVSIGTSDGSSFQSFQFSQSNILEDSIQVFVDAILWELYETVLLGGPDSQVWQLDKKPDETLHATFGDNTNGKIPAATAAITSEYRISQGALGNMGIGLIDTVVTSFGVTVNVTNTTAATGGGPAESESAAKDRAPITFLAQDRAVGLTDYEAITLGVNGVAKAQAVVDGVARIAVYVAPVGGGDASQALLDDVEDELDAKKVATDGVVARSANYVSISIDGDVRVLPTYRNERVKTDVLDTLDDFFALENRDFGEADSVKGDVRISDVFAAIENVNGVDFVELDILTMVPEVKWIIQTGDATFGAISISATTVAEIWTVTFVSSTEFSVRGTVSGIQLNNGTLGSGYTSDNGEVSFTVTAGGSPMAAGDKAQFRTSPVLGSVDILETEIAEVGNIALTFSGGVS